MTIILGFWLCHEMDSTWYREENGVLAIFVEICATTIYT